jgi:hypothetical protein
MELDGVPVHFKTLGDRNLPLQATRNGQLQVDDGAAPFADEMVVFGGIRIEAVEGAAEVDSGDQALLDENSDVPVDGSHAEAGELLLQPFVEPIRGGMGVRCSEQSKDPFTLLASSSLSILCHLNWAILAESD